MLYQLSYEGLQSWGSDSCRVHVSFSTDVSRRRLLINALMIHLINIYSIKKKHYTKENTSQQQVNLSCFLYLV